MSTPHDSNDTTRVMIVTGLSGSGKSVALHTLEDEGWYCIDNLPSELLPDVLDSLLATHLPAYEQIAIGIDMRSERHSADGLLELVRTLRNRSTLDATVLFLDTDRSTLAQRFSETRRRHPLSRDDTPLLAAIDEEAALLLDVRAAADQVIDTSGLNLHELRHIVRSHASGRDDSHMLLIFQSFGFKHGMPASTDFLFDVRFLPNPYWQSDIRNATGLDQPIIDYLARQKDVQEFYQDLQTFLDRWLPAFELEQRAYLTVSIGCTGGRHRSVYLVERLATHFRSRMRNLSVRHRELGATG